jgi:16S rRNA (guanine966-N2)-methyltransferase
VTPPGNDTRPTTDKVRQAVFNALDSAGLLDGASVIDLFAGSGALGIEALSRGASSCIFVERDRSAVEALRSNLTTLGIEGRSRVVVGDAATYGSQVGSIDLALVDPPYQFEAWEALLAGLDAAAVIAESDREIPAPEGWEQVRARRYGRTFITWLQRIA